MEGEIILPITVEKEPHQSIIWLSFLIVKIIPAYNAILDRPRLNALKAMVSIYHLLVQFSTKDGVREMQRDQMLARQYFLIATKIKKPVEALPIEIHDQKDNPEINKNQAKLIEQLITVLVGEDLEKTVQIRS